MRTTNNLGLKKPEGTDIVDIADLNGNMDTLDSAVKSLQDHAADTHLHITDAERTQWNAKETTAGAQAKANAAAAASVPLTHKGAANGVAPLDVYSKVPLANLPTGAGNGIDADKLDGHHYTDFMLADGTNTHFMELGAYRTWAGPAHIDFHSSGVGGDFDARIIADGGSGAANGTLNLQAGRVTTSAQLWVYQKPEYGASSGLILPIGDSDTGINWVSDGKLDFYSNNQVAFQLVNGVANYRCSDGAYRPMTNLWGDDTEGFRSYASAWRSTPMGIVNSTWTRVICNASSANYKGEYNESTGVFTAQKLGLYLVVFSVKFNSVPAASNRIMSFVIGASRYEVASASPGANGFDQNMHGSGIYRLGAGQTISPEIFSSTDVDVKVGVSTTFTVIRIA
ncbi:hypothetical protein [Paenibacillus zanthoxyli]|uniref:hypothetical protein n=1 Tax=Paenibacillus zanthoxyli TaxID=369399 RepID=UPI00046F96E0|nr:hypothetical protein [Paenibacillus zanthoxyli]